MQGNIRSLGGKALIALDDLVGVGVLERYHVVGKSNRVEKFAVIERAGDHRSHGIAGKALVVVGRDRTTVDADPERTIVFARNLGQLADLVGDSPLALVVV